MRNSTVTGKTVQSHVQDGSQIFASPLKQNQFKMHQGSETLKLLEQNMGELLQVISSEKDFLNRAPMVQEVIARATQGSTST